jgi:spoIIIJ-associated protein
VEARNKGRSVVASGKTVKDAIANGLAMLGVHQDQVDVEILTEGSRGVLGFGAENAQVKLTVKLPVPAEPPAPAMERQPKSHSGESRVVAERQARPHATEPKPVAEQPHQPSPSEAMPVSKKAVGEELKPGTDTTMIQEVGKEVLSEVLTLMGIQAVVEPRIGHELAEEGQAPPIVLNITGDDLGILIGRRGETLRALQYLVRLMVSHRLKQWTNLIVDVESYLTRRRGALESLALRVAERVERTGRAQALEPMPAYERRLVHIALRDHPKVSTHSVGEGEKRKVMIIPKR